jgi:hypothetical protein
LLSEHCKMCRRKKEYLTIFLLLTAHSNSFSTFQPSTNAMRNSKSLKGQRIRRINTNILSQHRPMHPSRHYRNGHL